MDRIQVEYYICLDSEIAQYIPDLEDDIRYYSSQRCGVNQAEELRKYLSVYYAARKVCESVMSMHRYIRRGQRSKAKRKYREAQDDAAYFIYLSESYPRSSYMLPNPCLRIFFDFDDDDFLEVL